MAAPRVAVVTGTARKSGIGHAVAAKLRQEGYRVMMLDREPPEDAGAAPAADVLQLDLAAQDHVLALAARLAERGISAVHVLVNNAAIAQPYLPGGGEQGGEIPAGTSANQTLKAGTSARIQAWQQYIAVNLTAPFLLSQVLLPLLVPEDSSIIHISSTRALQSEPSSEGYAAAKAGLLGLTHAQAATLAGQTRVNAILPGWIDTSSEPGSLREKDHAWHWAGRVGVPQDVAEAVAFLADGSRSGFITGQQLVVDGGVSRRMVYPDE